MNLADVDEHTLSLFLPDMDSGDLVISIRQMNCCDQEKIFTKIGRISGNEYADLVKSAVLQS